jgi:hypothetical protein
MADKPSLKTKLWPFGITLALILVPIIWVVLAVVISITRFVTRWPDRESSTVVIFIVLGLSLVPLALALLDFVSSRRAVIDIKGFKIDFSNTVLSQPEARPASFGLPDNIGISGPIISDTAPMQIIEALKQASEGEVAVIDLKDGNAWWVTRLLALGAGAMRVGSPKAMAFIGMKENLPDTYLGWAEPGVVVKAILADKPEYKKRYERARRIARQLDLFGDEVEPSNLAYHANVDRYRMQSEYKQLGEAAFEQILMDQLGTIIYNGVSLENPPDRLTLGRLQQLFDHCLYMDAVDLTESNEKQVSRFLESNAPYVALLRRGKFDRMLKREVGEALILRQLFLQNQPRQE